MHRFPVARLVFQHLIDSRQDTQPHGPAFQVTLVEHGIRAHRSLDQRLIAVLLDELENFRPALVGRRRIVPAPSLAILLGRSSWVD